VTLYCKEQGLISNKKQTEAEEEEEKRVVNMRLKRLEKGWRKQYSKVLIELENRFNLP
jgi:hypothetical protein